MGEQKRKPQSGVTKAFFRAITWLKETPVDHNKKKEAVANFGGMLKHETNRHEYKSTVETIMNGLKKRKEQELYGSRTKSENFNPDSAIGYISAFVDIQAAIDKAIAEGSEASQFLQNQKGQTQ